ncbi:dihydrofolate reductase family protein [Nonomuraea sp. NPDC049028]|uniref:dihydrofolate reductase family protein n=1 Tax=Nonomuraea sp. NPDC049028 TaxID=3364348 RepID=UPI0037228E72
MRKIVAGLFISLDGVVESPEKWHFPYFNDEMGEIVGSQMEQSDAMLLGRQTYQEFAAHWPHQDPADNPFADRMNNTPKYVVTNTLDTAEWQNTTIIKGDVVAGLTELKERPGKDIGITGSAALVRSLLADGLLDELRLLVHPIVVGSGKRLFEEGTGQLPLQLADSRTLSTGVLSLTYGRA